MDIPRMKEREEALRLYEANRDAQAALEAAENGENKEIEAQFEPRFEALHAKYNADREALRAEQAEALGIADLQAKADAAEKAWIASPLNIETAEDDDYNEIVVRCAKTGVVILEDDETVRDEGTGEVFLRAALGLPPRPVEQEEAA